MVFFFIFIGEKSFVAKTVTIKVMDVIVVYSSSGSCTIDTLKPRPTPPPPAHVLLCWLVGELSVSVIVAGEKWSTWHVDGLGCVVLEERLHEHAHRAEHAYKHKDPQEEAVDHHGNILPVLAHLWLWNRVKRKIKVSRIPLSSPVMLIIIRPTRLPLTRRNVNGGEVLMWMETRSATQLWWGLTRVKEEEKDVRDWREMEDGEKQRVFWNCDPCDDNLKRKGNEWWAMHCAGNGRILKAMGW